MDMWDKSQREDRDQLRRHRRENPSFSSSLLDAIYRSIDESNGEGEEKLILYRETMRRKQNTAAGWTEEQEIVNFRRACMIEKWMEKKKVGEKVVIRRNSMVDFDRKARNVRDRDFTTMNSSSSSSESSCTAGRFSSSESEFLSRALQRPKPIKTSAWSRFEQSKLQTFGGHGDEASPIPTQKPKHENGFVKTKSKASKIYHDLKKVKQPISPGGRLANFLNSLFNGGSPKTKPKLSNSINTNYDDDSSRKSKSAQGSTCSSASSFSRSCLSKTPSSRGNLGNNGNTKRSVRFCPVSVIVDEDCQPCGHKSLRKDEPDVMAAMTILKKPLKNYGKFDAEEVNVGELLKSYHHQTKINGNEAFDNEDDEDDEDDAVSCSSSDLFELDNLSVIGIERYQEELPVYETTHFNTNCAIANGLVL